MDKKPLIEQFKNFTGVEDVQLSTSLLEASNWDPHRAISSYFENSSEADHVEYQTKKPQISGNNKLINK